MDFEDIFENNGKHRKNGHHENEHSYKNAEYHHEHGNNGYEIFNKNENPKYQGFNQTIFLKTFIEKLKNNKKLQVFVVFLAVILVVLFIILLVLILPLISKLVNYISENGIQGVVEYLRGLLEKILVGSKGK